MHQGQGMGQYGDGQDHAPQGGTHWVVVGLALVVIVLVVAFIGAVYLGGEAIKHAYP